jgi:transcriptional regulator with XRE-family HTH domain
MKTTAFAAELRPTPALKRHVGEQIRRLREKHGLTQADACVTVFGTEQMQSQWSRWEAGRTLPHLGSLVKIARWAKVSLDTFAPPEK